MFRLWILVMEKTRLLKMSPTPLGTYYGIFFLPFAHFTAQTIDRLKEEISDKLIENENNHQL